MGRVVKRHATVFNGDVNKRSMNVLGHVLLVATDVKVSPALKPFPYFCAVFFQTVLNIDFLFLACGKKLTLSAASRAIHRWPRDYVRVSRGRDDR